MIFQLTVKNCQVLDQSRIYIDKHLAKIAKLFPNIQSDLMVVRLLIKKNIDKYHPKRARHDNEKTYADSKPALAYFEGSITLRLNRNRFYASFKGQTIDEGVNLGFHRIVKELKKFKNLHFSSESKYPDRNSIREGAFENY